MHTSHSTPRADALLACLSTHRRRERERATKDKFNMAGTVIGNILGVKAEAATEGEGTRSDVQDDQFTTTANQQSAAAAAAAAEEDEEGEGGDYKKNSMYGEHMKKPSEAMSEFSRTKTISEQRAFLPIYGCRQELLNVIRDNSVIILVGETVRAQSMRTHAHAPRPSRPSDRRPPWPPPAADTRTLHESAAAPSGLVATFGRLLSSGCHNCAHLRL